LSAGCTDNHDPGIPHLRRTLDQILKSTRIVRPKEKDKEKERERKGKEKEKEKN
jgi:hypothetical protein